MTNFRMPRYPGLFLRMGAAWVSAPLLIRVLPLPRLLQVYSPPRGYPRDEEGLKRIPCYLKALMRLFPFGKGQECLRRCLVLFYFLNRGGEPVVIRFGVRKTKSGEWVGHSWLTRPDGSLWKQDPQVNDFSEMAAFSLD